MGVTQFDPDKRTALEKIDELRAMVEAEGVNAFAVVAVTDKDELMTCFNTGIKEASLFSLLGGLSTLSIRIAIGCSENVSDAVREAVLDLGEQ